MGLIPIDTGSWMCFHVLQHHSWGFQDFIICSPSKICMAFSSFASCRVTTTSKISKSFWRKTIKRKAWSPNCLYQKIWQVFFFFLFFPMWLEKCLVSGISIMIIVVLMGRHRDFFEFKNNQNYSETIFYACSPCISWIKYLSICRSTTTKCCPKKKLLLSLTFIMKWTEMFCTARVHQIWIQKSVYHVTFSSVLQWKVLD